MSTIQAPLALVGDPDNKFLLSLASSSPHMIEAAATRKEVEIKLKEQPWRYSGIFINPRLSSPNGISLVQFAREHCPATPIFFILDKTEDKLETSEAEKITVYDSFVKPLSHLDIEAALARSKVKPHKVKTNFTGKEIEVLGIAFQDSDSDFTPIRARCFIAGNESYFDVYVKLSHDKYVKILAAGDQFSSTRIKGFINKGVEYFYLRKSAQENYMKYCDALTHAVLGKQEVSQDVKVSHVMNWGEETSKFLQNAGLNEGAINYAKRFTKNVHGIIKDLKLENVDLIQKHLKNNQHFDHSMSTLMVASLLAIPLGLTSEKSASIVGLSALFHDIGLETMSEKIQSKKTETFCPAEKKEFERHPTIGQELLSQIPGIDPVVLQAVAQHHERRTGKGYPVGLGTNQIHLVAEIIGLSEELVQEMENISAHPEMNLSLLKRMELIAFNGFSSSVINTLKIYLR